MCERELETEQNSNILTLTLLAITAFLSRSPGLLNRGPSISGCWFSLPHLISNSSDPQLSIRGLMAPSAGYWLSLPHLVSNWLNFLCTGLYNSSTPTFFLWTSQSHSFNPSTVKVIFWYSLSGCTCYLHKCIFLFWQPGRVVGQYTIIWVCYIK